MKKRYYFLSILILFLFNIVQVSALENNNQVYFYNNNGTSVNSVSTSYDSSNSESYAIFTTYANSYGGLLVYQLSSPLVKDHMYKLFVNVGAANDGGYARLSTKNYIGLGTSLSAATNSYINNTISPSFSQATDISTDKGRGLYFIFTANMNSTFIAIPYTSQYNCTNCYQYSYGLEIEDVGNTAGLSSRDITNITNNQTAIIQNDIVNLQDNFNNTIKDTFENCESSDNLFTSTFINGSLDTTGGISHGYDGWSVVTNELIPVKPNTTYTFSNKSNYRIDRVAFYSNTKEFISRSNSLNSSTFTTPEGVYYIRFNIWQEGIVPSDLTNIMLNTGSTAKPFEPVCKNKLDTLNDTQKETNDKLDSLNDNITNSDSSEATGEASDFFSNFNTDTFGLTSVITAPLELIKSITSKSCTSLHGTLPFVNTEVNLPCLSTIYENYFGSFLTIYRTITFGFVSYWVCIKIFNLVKDFKNPEHDEIEVLDL